MKHGIGCVIYQIINGMSDSPVTAQTHLIEDRVKSAVRCLGNVKSANPSPVPQYCSHDLLSSSALDIYRAKEGTERYQNAINQSSYSTLRPPSMCRRLAQHPIAQGAQP